MGLEKCVGGTESLNELSRNQSASPDKWIVAVMHPYYPAWSMCLVRGPVVQKPW